MGRRAKKLKPTTSASGLLGTKLRKHRERMGWTQDELGAMTCYTGDQISKIELGKRMPSWKAVVEFDRLFGTGEYFQDMWLLADQETLPVWFRPYAELEGEAREVRTFGLSLIHGLFQTEEYATDVLSVGRDPEEVARHVAARMKRQEILDRKGAMRFWVVLDETVLHRPTNRPGVMKGQIAHLIELAQRPDITVQIIPASRGPYMGLVGPITILSFDDRPDAVFFEDQLGGRLVEGADAVKQSGTRFELIRASALPWEESLDLLLALLESE